MSNTIKKIQAGTITYDIEPAQSAAIAITNNAPTLSWNTTSTIATVDGTAITVKLPVNPNTWRGIQDNLTSTSTTDSLSANQGRALNAKFASYMPLSGGTFTGVVKTVENTMGLKLRTHASYETGWIYGTSGNEAVTLAMQNPVTAFQIVYGTAPSEFTSSTWQSVTPLFQTKDGKVIINRKIGATSETTNLKLFDVNGDANATTLYENGTALSSKYKAIGAYSKATSNTTTVASNAHTHTGPSHTHTYAKATSASFTGSSVDTGSAGGHSHTFTGTAVTSGTPSATTSVATYNHTHTGPNHQHSYDKATSATFNPSTVNSGGPIATSGTTSTTTVVTGSLSGTVLTLSTTTVASSVHLHAVTASGTISLSHTSTNSGWSGTGATGAASASVTVASNAHTHSVTAKGTLNSTGSHTHSVAAEGEIELGYTSTNSGSGGTGNTGIPSANTTVPTSGHTHGVS